MLDSNITKTEIERWLRETDERKLEELWRAADETRKKHVGDAVHLRGLIEISNICVRQCLYCGIRADNDKIARYRMTETEIMDCVRQAVEFGYGTVVMQAGEDYGFSREFIANIICRIKSETKLAVTLSLGERPEEDLVAWKQAGADRYLLRFETSDERLYRAIHPDLPGKVSDRIAILRQLRALGYEAGSGVMIGIPGQAFASLANDINLFRELDLDMIGVGPFIAHPETPLGQDAWKSLLSCAPADQVPNDELMTYKAVALARLVRPDANIPSTTALATLNKETGRELGLQRGANIVMPNLTPVKYRALYEIYPEKSCINETAEMCRGCLRARIESIGRIVGTGEGGRRKS